MLLTTNEISEIYGGVQKNVTPYMITHTWIPNGLKFIRGKGNSYLFKKEWVDEYLEESAITKMTKNQKKSKTRKMQISRKNTTILVH